MIKLVVFDYDGVFTNGNIMFDKNGNILKSYNVKDGTGIKMLLKNNIQVGVISGYKENQSQLSILEHLKIKFISLNTHDKLNVIKKWCNTLNIDLNQNVVYMGDDINDLNILENVYMSCCPQDAHKKCLEICNYISSKKGGDGCIRELCDYILENKIENKEKIIYEIKSEFNYQIKNFNVQEINKLANIIKNHKYNIYFGGVGKSGNIAKHCCDLFKCISLKSFYLDILNLNHGDIGTIHDKDIVILFSNSGNTIELINLLKIINKKNVITVGICCNKSSKFLELCQITIVTPFQSEISGEIDKIPTNSVMSQLIFSNILISLLKKNITIGEYKNNHLNGSIGKHLLQVKDVIITKFPKIYVTNNNIEFNIILLEMTKYKIGACFFIDENDKLLGMITDGDIRRLISKNSNFNLNNYINKKLITIDNKFCYINDLIKYKNNYIPVIENNKILGIIRI